MPDAVTDKKLELVSFKLCPFVQRSVITLLEKQIDFKMTYIDLANPPGWFLELSPLAKVPVLRVGETVLFESVVINEYLDEVTPPTLPPDDPLERARHRAWIEFGSDMIMNHYLMQNAEDEQAFRDCRDRLLGQFQQLEPVVSEGPYFDGGRLSLVDAAYAPLLMPIELMDDANHLGLYATNSRVGAWARAVLELRSVQASVSRDFAEAYYQFVSAMGGYYSTLRQQAEMYLTK